MRIVGIETILLRCPEEEHPHPTASFVHEGSVLLRVFTDEGIIGIGEPSPYGGRLPELQRAIEERVKPDFLGKNPSEVAKLTRQRDYPEPLGLGNAAHNSAIAGMSQALWDIIGKAKNMPVYRLLNPGVEVKHRVRAYASGGMWYEWEDPQRLVEEALRCQAEGYTAWKLRPETPKPASHFERNQNPPPIDVHKFISIAEKLRDSVGDSMDLMVDAGCRFRDVEEARMVGAALHDLDFLLLEEPLPRKIEDYVRLRQLVSIPIAGGECFVSRKQAEKWICAGALNVLQPDGNLAGLHEVMAIAAIGQEHELPLVIHNWANDVSIAANVHLAAALPNCHLVEYNVTYNPLRTELVDDPFVPEDGFFYLSDKPGLGIELDEQALERFSFDG